jgi:hypothetical protein
MADNSKALENGFNKAKQIIREQVEKGLMVQANKLVEKAYKLYHSPKMAFTGQTWTGTAVGVYSNGALIYVITTKQFADMPAPVRKKLTSGEYAFLKPDYMGRHRGYKGVIETDKENSEQDAIGFLQGHRVNGKYGITVVSGSEYASYIEDVLKGDVITGTYHYAHGLRAVDLVKAS